jgi:hypothetical protein
MNDNPNPNTNNLTAILASPIAGATGAGGGTAASLLYYMGLATPYMTWLAMALAIVISVLHLYLILRKMWKGKIDEIEG